MNKLAMLAVALGSFIAGALTVLAFIVMVPAASHDSMQSGHSHRADAGAFDGSSSGSNFHSEMSTVNARMHEGMEIAPSGDADQDFIGMMIPHHQGAIDMALVLLKYGHDERLRRLAQSIIVEQGQEITYMWTLRNAQSTERPSAQHAADR
jgi:uncharacterized protein (DUF305 family)